MIPRRSLLRGLAAFVTAPAIVRASSLMPVSTAALWPSVDDGVMLPAIAHPEGPGLPEDVWLRYMQYGVRLMAGASRPA